jgi:hypothetical protein
MLLRGKIALWFQNTIIPSHAQLRDGAHNNRTVASQYGATFRSTSTISLDSYCLMWFNVHLISHVKAFFTNLTI